MRCDSQFPATPSGHLLVPARESAAPGFNAILLSLVIPTFNESENIRPFLEAIRQNLDPLLQDRYEVIVVDDDSPDRTWERAAHVAQDYPQLRVMRRTTEQGLSTAVIRGWQVARGDVLGTMNADFQHPPSVFPEMLRGMESADLVVATRYAKGGSVGSLPAHRRMLSKVARCIGAMLLPEIFARVTDPLSGFYLFRRRSIEGIRLRPAGFKTLVELLGRGYIDKVTECGYEMQSRRTGKSNVKFRHTLDYLVQLRRIQTERKRRPC